jgi:hypothetical protein
MDADGHDDLIEEVGSSTDEVEMTECHGVETSSVNRDRAGHCFQGAFFDDDAFGEPDEDSFGEALGVGALDGGTGFGAEGEGES